MQQTEASRFLERAAQIPWSWADANCLTLLGDWIDARRGTAIAASWRAHGYDEQGAKGAVIQAGGMLAFLDREARAAGLGKIDPADAQDGDIGLIAVATLEGDATVSFEIGALRCGDCWGAKTMGGVMAARCGALAAWRV